MSDDTTGSHVPVLAIDGPSGSGKGTISRLVASRLGWHYLDSGALYRAVGLAAGWADIDLSDSSALVRCAFDTQVGFIGEGPDEPRIIVNGTLAELKQLLPPAKVEYVEKQPTLEEIFLAIIGNDTHAGTAGATVPTTEEQR